MQDSQSQIPVKSEAEESFDRWRLDPETINFFKFLREKREDRKERMANGHYASQHSSEFIAQHAIAQGYCAALKDILELSFEELQEDFREK